MSTPRKGSKKTSAKKTSTRRPPVPPAAPSGEALFEVASASSVTLRRRSSSRLYDPLFEALQGLEPGQGIKVPLPEGKDAKKHTNTMRSALGQRVRNELDKSLTIEVVEDAEGNEEALFLTLSDKRPTPQARV